MWHVQRFDVAQLQHWALCLECLNRTNTCNRKMDFPSLIHQPQASKHKAQLERVHKCVPSALHRKTPRATTTHRFT